MIARYRTLSARIGAELDDLERSRKAVEQHWQRALTAGVDQDAYLNSVALNLHAVYSGIERIFTYIADELDGGPPTGAEWHAQLLRQMALDLSPSRPPVLAADTAAALVPYLRFRHLIRNIYATNLDPDRMKLLISGLPGVWMRVTEDLTAFRLLLDQLAESESD